MAEHWGWFAAGALFGMIAGLLCAALLYQIATRVLVDSVAEELKKAAPPPPPANPTPIPPPLPPKKRLTMWG